MHKLYDTISLSTGMLTAGIGGSLTLNLTTVSEIMGILAAGAGVVLTVCTLYWRYREHKRRMKK